MAFQSSEGMALPEHFVSPKVVAILDEMIRNMSYSDFIAERTIPAACSIINMPDFPAAVSVARRVVRGT
jgi:hypothetical protein